MIEKIENMENTGRQESVSFGINGQILNNILEFVMDIDSEIPIRFYKDKLVISQKGCDNVQFAQIEIDAKGLLHYRLDSEKKEIVIDTRNVKLEYMYNIIEMMYDGGEEIVEVKVFDNDKIKRIEFHLPGNVITWAKLLDREQFPSLGGDRYDMYDKISECIKKVRNDKEVKKAVAIIEPSTFERICEVKSPNGNGGRVFKVEIDKKNGLSLTSTSKDKFYELKIKPECIGIVVEDTGSDDNGNQYIYIDRKYIEPFRKIKGLTPIAIELRSNKPIILEQRDCSGINVLLTVAPRIDDSEKEKEDKKDKKDEDKKDEDKKVENMSKKEDINIFKILT